MASIQDCCPNQTWGGRWGRSWVSGPGGAAPPTFSLGAWGGAVPSFPCGSRACLCWAPSPLPTLQPLPQASRPSPGWQRPPVQTERSWQLREKEVSAAAATTQTVGWGGSGGQRSGNTSTRVAQGSSGAKLSRKETHMSHVSLAGPTAGAVMVAASGRHPPWSPAR